MSASSSNRENMQTENASSRAAATLVATVPSNLPRALTPLIGREREIQTLRDLLLREDVPLVTITGFGGAGKTTLALHVASSLLAEFSGGVFFVNLAALTDPKLIIDTVAQTLNVPEEQNRNLLDSLRDFFLGRSILLVLDNLEQLVDGAPQVNALLEASPQLKVIATSREALRLRGEQVLPLSSLADEAAIELFTQRARAVNPDFHSDRDAILAICCKLDGLPLAIELAAQRSKLFSIPALLQRLQSDLGADSPILSLLTSGARDLPARQRTLRDAIAWSYSLLTPAEQSLFRAAALFPAGAWIESIASVAALPESEAMEGVASLVDKSLLRSVAGESARVIMLESLREFAREESARLGELEQNVEKFIEGMAAFTHQAGAGIRSNEQAEWFARLDVEHPNALAALDLALQRQPASEPWKTAFAILNDLHRYWMLRGISHLGEEWIERGRLALEQYEAALSRKEARSADFLRMKANTLTVSGSLAWARGRYSKARDWHLAGLQIYEQLNDQAGMAETLNNLAVNQQLLGEYRQAVSNFQRGLMLSRNLGDRWAEMRQLNNLAACENGLGNPDGAYRIYLEGLSIAEELGDQYFVSAFLYNLADTSVQRAQFDKARPLLERSMLISNGMKLVYMQAWSYMLLARVELGFDRLIPAIQAMRNAISYSENIADADLNRLILWTMASLCVRAEKIPAAATMMGALEAFIQSSRISPTPYEARQAEMYIKQIRSRLTPDQFRAAHDAGSAMSPQAAFGFWLEQIRDLGEGEPAAPSALSMFTEREMDVLKLLAQGKTNQQISQELVVTLKTVEKHAASVMRKLGVKNRTEVAAWAMKEGLVE